MNNPNQYTLYQKFDKLYPYEQPHIVVSRSSRHICGMEQKVGTHISTEISVSEIMESHILFCKISGQTVAAYCREQGISTSKFYYWQKQFKGRQANPGFVQLEPASISIAAVNIQFPKGVRVSFDNSIHTDVLKELICCI